MEQRQKAKPRWHLEKSKPKWLLKFRTVETCSDKFMIWSTLERAWWGPNAVGYTTTTHKAGLFSSQAAKAFMHMADERNPPEHMDFMVEAPLQNDLDKDLANNGIRRRRHIPSPHYVDGFAR